MEAGLTPGLLHYHFATKDALLEACLRRASDDYSQRVQGIRDTVPPGKMVESYLTSARQWVEEDASFFRVRLAFAARALANPGPAGTFRDLNRVAVDATAQLLAADRGAARPSAGDRQRAAVAKAAFDGIMLAVLTALLSRLIRQKAFSREA